MATEYEIARSSGKCVVTERPLEPGEHYHAVLIETDEGFERHDYCLEAWKGPPENAFCHWRGRVPVKDEKAGPIQIDHALLANLFAHLENESSEMKQKFRFVLALLLMRKRLLRLERTDQDEEQEFWMMRLGGDETQYKVLNPRLTADEVERLSMQLSALLSGDVDPQDAIDGNIAAASRADQQEASAEEGDAPSDDASASESSESAETPSAEQTMETSPDKDDESSGA